MSITILSMCLDQVVGRRRALLAQNEGVDDVLPRALALLRDEPLTEGDFHPGDLLIAVLRLDGWQGRSSAFRGAGLP